MQWEHLVKAALLGSERQNLTLPLPSGDPLDDALSRLDATDPEGALLGAAALLTLYRQAGRQPAISAAPLPIACPPDNLPECSPRAASHLATMLSGQYVDLLPEWLGLLRQRGQRVPPKHLHSLLDRGHQHNELRELVLPVLGQRGRWLAAHNAAWDYAIDIGTPDAEERWQTGTRNARLSLLRRLRADEPDRARALLETTWAQDGAKERTAFLGVLQANLSMDDEPFLEAALDDRSKEVRRVAANLLARLPDSRLVQRTIEWVKPLLTFHKGSLLKSARPDVTLPEECTKDMQRDGVEPTPPDKAWGKQGWWLQQMLAMVPPAFWCQQWGIAADEAVKIVYKSEWTRVLRQGVAQATLRHQDAAWAEALLTIDAGLDVRLITVLPAEQGEQIIVNMFPDAFDSIEPLQIALQFLQQYPFDWSRGLSKVLLENLQRKTRSKNKQSQLYWQLYQAFNLFAYRADTAVLDAALNAWTHEGDTWVMHDPRLRESFSILQFRHDMRQALNA